MECYGVPVLPAGGWHCDPCGAGLSCAALPCALCPALGGAMKAVAGGGGGGGGGAAKGRGGAPAAARGAAAAATHSAANEYVHVACALFVPEVTFADEDALGPALNVAAANVRWPPLPRAREGLGPSLQPPIARPHSHAFATHTHTTLSPFPSASTGHARHAKVPRVRAAGARRAGAVR